MGSASTVIRHSKGQERFPDKTSRIRPCDVCLTGPGPALQHNSLPSCSSVPACASLSVAIHVIHVLPATEALALRDELLRNAENNSAVALYRCHQALELDGQAHDYSADDWLPAIYDIAAPLLEASFSTMSRLPSPRVECTATSRLLVHEEIAGRLTESIVEATRQLKVGPGLDERTQVGPVVSDMIVGAIFDSCS